MSQRNRGVRRSRGPTNRETRAAGWLAHEAAKSRKIGGSNDGRAPTIFNASRPITNPGAIFEHEIIKDLRRETTAKVLTKLCVSLITTQEARKLARQNNDPEWSKMAIKALREKAGTLPEDLDGFCIRALITGAAKNQTGPRFVSLLLDKKNSVTILDERRQLLGALPERVGGSGLKKPTPHVTIFETNDQAVAENLCAGLRDAVKHTTPEISMGPVSVDLARYRQPAYRIDGGY